MLLTLEMPSFVADDSRPMLSPQYPPPEPLAEVRNSNEKINASNRPSFQKSVKASFENGVEHQQDSVYRTNLSVNGDLHNDGGLNSLPNGRSSRSSWEKRSTRNDSALSVNETVNGVTETKKSSVAPQDGASKVSMDKTSVASMNGSASETQLPTEPSSRQAIANGDGSGLSKAYAVPPPLSTNPQSTGPLTYTSSLVPATPTPETPSRKSTASAHRFSSPPTYQSPTPATPIGASTSSLQQPVPPPLKHRHTLQVPKPGPSRGSKDAEDGVYTSGRFSPTTAADRGRRGSLNLYRRNTRSTHSDMPHEEVPQDEDAMRWAEAIRQKRASKRKRKDEEDDDRVVVGTKVDQNHVNWVTAYNMLTGIRFTVSRTNAKMDRPLTDVDFEQRHKFSFDITGNELTPSAKYDFKFKDYAPWVFRHLRAKFKLDPADYLMSLTSKYILSELGSPGKSGSFFYFSRDYKYIIKTIHHAEHKFLRKILKDYYNHVEQNPNTLLSQFYGLHRVKIPYGRKIHFVVMNNLFPPHRDIHHTFDLKGSTIGRDFKEEELAKNPRATLKDLNWLRRHLHLEFGPEKKRLFIEQMERDVRLLQKLKIMDYSLLVGVHDLEKGNQENLRDKTLKVFQPGGEQSPVEPLSTNFPLTRTPSKLENIRKARELRQIIKQEKPIPMGQTISRMPEHMEENAVKKEFTFYSDDGGFQAAHEDNSPGNEIYYLGIIDCLTHYGMIKRVEHFWKGLSNDKSQISPVPSVPYGDRFIKFISGVTMSPEEAEREKAAAEQAQTSTSTTNPGLGDHLALTTTSTDNQVIRKAETEAIRSENSGLGEPAPDRTITAVRSPSAERTNDRAGMTLPIVDEVGESSSTGGRSASADADAEVESDLNENKDGVETEREKEERPATPPKDKSLSPAQARMQRRPASSRNSSFDSNKALPPIPPPLNLEKHMNGNGKEAAPAAGMPVGVTV